MPLQFMYRRTVRNNRIQVANITYLLADPVPDGAAVQAIFSGSQQDGRRLGYCSIYMDSRRRDGLWPYGAACRIEAAYETEIVSH